MSSDRHLENFKSKLNQFKQKYYTLTMKSYTEQVDSEVKAQEQSLAKCQKQLSQLETRIHELKDSLATKESYKSSLKYKKEALLRKLKEEQTVSESLLQELQNTGPSSSDVFNSSEYFKELQVYLRTVEEKFYEIDQHKQNPLCLECLDLNKCHL